ncbi:hypothetical protein ACFQZO_30875 [Bradyrhizobium sp. GCM10027634]|uniref:hypothetical protein n=1 Tax=unclassified Bradyrhizobium TaxID=2631580 RepID=UPI00263A47B9|nr:hypothetical protein [Bradyrhizobium sp. WYCCWR 12677]MDN5005265.1 hypothetical protein [Bradyrhizobium sp. WYCCWR 12677]
MNDSPNTPWTAFVTDAQTDFPEHFDWGALAMSRARSVPAATTSAANISSERNGASGEGQASSQTAPPVAEPEPHSGVELISLREVPANIPAGALAPVPEPRAAHGDDAGLPDSHSPESEVLRQEALRPAKTGYPPLSLPNDGIQRLRFSDIGEPSEPGQYRSPYGLVEITRNDLAVWKAFPDAIFAIIAPSPYSSATIFRLGTFEV